MGKMKQQIEELMEVLMSALYWNLYGQGYRLTKLDCSWQFHLATEILRGEQTLAEVLQLSMLVRFNPKTGQFEHYHGTLAVMTYEHYEDGKRWHPGESSLKCETLTIDTEAEPSDKDPVTGIEYGDMT